MSSSSQDVNVCQKRWRKADILQCMNCFSRSAVCCETRISSCNPVSCIFLCFCWCFDGVRIIWVSTKSRDESQKLLAAVQTSDSHLKKFQASQQAKTYFIEWLFTHLGHFFIHGFSLWLHFVFTVVLHLKMSFVYCYFTWMFDSKCRMMFV